MLATVLHRLGNLKTTSAGIVLSGLVAYVLESWKCQLPSDWLKYALEAGPAILGILAKDK